ncbi:MAG TPA: TIR domain-containing protein [Candidatus Kapabacteria bacterium]
MADIFISYSSYNREKATSLVNELRSRGYDIWMDQGGIGGAMDWSSEIVEALNKAKTVLFLISKDSVTSHNCAKEIHLANEKHKNILPVVLEDTPLPVLFEYPLAGLQRVPYERTDAILQALDVLKGGKSVLEAMLTQSKVDDGLIRLAVLPFEDRSPTQDNEWFASGMTDELIDTLGSLSNMKVNPRGDVVYYKKNRTKSEEIAQDLNVRYIVEGAVQKAGERIRIIVTLTDVKARDQIWRNKYDGTFEDIFDLQDKTCFAITEAIKLTLTPEDKKKIEKKPTENAEAYELFLKGDEYYSRATRSDYEHALSLYEEAVRRDPYFSAAYADIAHTCQSLYRFYTRSESLLSRAESAAAKVREFEGETAQYFWVMSMITHSRGQSAGALQLALRAVETNPMDHMGYDALGFAYHSLGMVEETVQAREELVRLWPNQTNAHFNLLSSIHELGETTDALERLRKAAERAIHVFDRHVRLNPDDYYARVQLANIFLWAQRESEALTEAERLSALKSVDGFALYNLACLYLNCHQQDRGMAMLHRSIEKGFRNLETFLHDPDLAPLRGTPEFDELIKELEEKLRITN